MGNHACSPCPAHSDTAGPKAVECTCVNRYFRSDKDDKSIPCSRMYYSLSMKYRSVYLGVLKKQGLCISGAIKYNDLNKSFFEPDKFTWLYI